MKVEPPLGHSGEMDEPRGGDKFDRFTRDLGRSGLVTHLDDTLRAFRERPPSELNSSDETTNLGGWLIGQGVLTYWQ
jgi:hypothetical protein